MPRLKRARAALYERASRWVAAFAGPGAADEAPGPPAEGAAEAGSAAPPDGEDGAGAASRGDALDEEAADEFEDDEEEWLDIDAEDGWPAELR